MKKANLYISKRGRVSGRRKVKKKKVLKVIGIVVLVLVLFDAIGTGLWFANYKGYFGKGNKSIYSVKNAEVLENSPLEGMHIAFLGSSVTEGARSKGNSFVEYICKRNNCTYVKEAVSGTTLVDNGETSYVQRMRNNMDATEKFDLFVCQLSTNDASQNLVLGEITGGMSLEEFDTSTIIGAMEYIICYAEETWSCPVVFYTGTKFDNELYPQMISALDELQEKWGIEVIDMWNGLDVDIENYSLYMADDIHPTQAGYLEWWTPFMEQRLYEIVKE